MVTSYQLQANFYKLVLRLVYTSCTSSCFDSSSEIPDPHYASKVDYIYKSPYQRTLYLDSDTRICDDIAHMFDLLDRYDIALAYSHSRVKQLDRYIGQAPIGFLPLNSGVILYKSTIPVIEFFKNWQKAYHQEGKEKDQFTLRDQLWFSDLKLFILPPEYNCRPRRYIKLLKSFGVTPKILHLLDIKREAGIPPFESLPLLKRIKHTIRFKIMPKIRKSFLGSPY